MPGCKRDSKIEETEMGQSQSWNTNTSIFYVHECEKKETKRSMETAGNGCTNQSCVLMKSCRNWETVPPTSTTLCRARNKSRMATG